MQLATFESAGRRRVGVVVGDEIADITLADPGIPCDILSLLEAGPRALARAEEAAAAAPRLHRTAVRLRAPVLRPPKVLAVGLNYPAHVRETAATRPTVPVVFNKQPTAVIGPSEPIWVPPESSMIDYEGELAVVIGTRCRRVPASRAREAIAGFTICNDVSVRDWQKQTPTMTMGKSWDSHCPLGPVLVTTDEIPDPHDLRIVTRVSGEVRQDGRTADMIFSCYELIEHLSTAFTLEPGDVISTGTPAGVGVAMQPPRWLRPGDVVSVRIDGIGELANPVAAEPVSA